MSVFSYLWVVYSLLNAADGILVMHNNVWKTAYINYTYICGICVTILLSHTHQL